MYGFPTPAVLSEKITGRCVKYKNFTVLTHEDPRCVNGTPSLKPQTHLNMLSTYKHEDGALRANLNHFTAGYRSLKSNREPRRAVTAVLGGLARALNCVSQSVHGVPWLHCREERNVVADCAAKVFAT